MSKKSEKKIEVVVGPPDTDARRKSLRDAAGIARRVLGSDAPGVVFGVCEILAYLEDAYLAESAVRSAVEKAVKIDHQFNFTAPAEPEDLLELTKVLFSDDAAEARVEDAAREAAVLFGGATERTLAAVVGVYYELYGEDEDSCG